MSAFALRHSVSYSPIVRAVMNLHYTLQTSMKEAIPTPRDQPHYRWHGAAHRVLLIGNGAAQGWGVYTHGYALTGQLGMAMSNHLGVPVNVDHVGEELMSVETITEWIADVPIERYDAIIMMMGLPDALRMTPAVTWTKSMQRFLREVRARKSDTTPFLAVGIEPINGAPGYNPVVGYIAQRHADLLNDLIRKQLTGDNEYYMEVSPRLVDYGRNAVPATTYRPWAEEIAQVAAPLLPRHTPEQDLSGEQIQFNWVGTARALGYDGRPSPTRLSEIEREAKKAFGVYLAQINLMDGGRQWVLNPSGPVPSSVPKDLTYCATTVQHDGLLIVSNATQDERFKNNPYLKQAHQPFYAGKALFSREGKPVATFCLMDILPRPKALLNKRRFEELWGQAQTEIWRIEDEVQGLVPASTVVAGQLAAANAFDLTVNRQAVRRAGVTVWRGVKRLARLYAQHLEHAAMFDSINTNY